MTVESGDMKEFSDWFDDVFVILERQGERQMDYYDKVILDLSLYAMQSYEAGFSALETAVKIIYKFQIKENGKQPNP